jgi:nucleotide-binding universal stress UspA family protein
MPVAMKWCIGFDLSDDHQAPALLVPAFDERAECIAVHVVEPYLERVASEEQRDQMRSGARLSLEAAVKRAGLPADRTEIVVGHGRPADEVLAEIALARGADAIIVSRRAKHIDERIVRLGGTARRLLRRLPMPVVVVTPELEADALGRGPILLAGDGHHDARRASTFARDFGTHTGRNVEMVHVYRERFRPSGAVPQPYVAGMYDRYREQQHAKLERWLSAYNLGGLPCHETEGHVLERIIDVGRKQDACMIVCASRQLSTADRIFTSSVGSQLAAWAPMPIAVVPH